MIPVSLCSEKIHSSSLVLSSFCIYKPGLAILNCSNGIERCKRLHYCFKCNWIWILERSQLQNRNGFIWSQDFAQVVTAFVELSGSITNSLQGA